MSEIIDNSQLTFDISEMDGFLTGFRMAKGVFNPRTRLSCVADDILPPGNSHSDLESHLVSLQQALDGNSLRISRAKSEYMTFQSGEEGKEGEAHLVSLPVKKVEELKYMKSVGQTIGALRWMSLTVGHTGEKWSQVCRILLQEMTDHEAEGQSW